MADSKSVIEAPPIESGHENGRGIALSLEIAELYGHVTLQGGPQLGLRRFGVPPGGPFDRESHALANALLGNDLDAPCVELAMAAGRFVCTSPVLVGLAGAPCLATVDEAEIAVGHALTLNIGHELRLSPPTLGARIYLSLPGGVRCQALRREGVLMESDQSRGSTDVDNKTRWPRSSMLDRPLRCMPFGDPGALLELAGCPNLKARLDSDRVGIRLDGIQLDPGPEQLSEPACPGAIQVTNDGSVIVLGPDGPTIGGYRKIGVVCSADLDALGQLRPGGSVRFASITREEAVEAWARLGVRQ